MKLFISTNVTNPKDLLLHQRVIQELKKLGVSIITNLDVKQGNFDGTGFASLDAVIIDASASDAETGYTLAIALAHKKPVLYLLRKGALIDSTVSTLAKNADVKRNLHVQFYTDDTFSKKIKGFLQYLDQNIGRESFTIKYTLRLSPRIDRYLSWKSGQAKKNKADFLRDWVDEMMKGDSDYTSRLE